MARETIAGKLVVRRIRNWPYYRIDALGPRAQASPGELVVPISLSIDTALLDRRTNLVKIDVPDLTQATGSVTGAQA